MLQRERMLISQQREWYSRVFPIHKYSYRVKYRNLLIALLLLVVLVYQQPWKAFSLSSWSSSSTSSSSQAMHPPSLRTTSVSSVLPHDFRMINGCFVDVPELDTVRHIVTPPTGSIHLVCCNTTQGYFTVAVHPSWAPYGAARFLEMVESKFFTTKVGLFRSLKGFLVQFGLAGDPRVQEDFHRKGNLPDDPQWLPAGSPGRVMNGVTRYQKGYMSYAGAGKNSRGTQLILAYENNLYLGGGSPWEVPFGILVGNESFVTMSKFYTGYGEAPEQGKIMNRGVAYLEEEFPLLDFITSCHVVGRNLPYQPMPPAYP